MRRIADDNNITMSVEGRIENFEYRIVNIEGEKDGVLKGITDVLKIVHEM